MLKSILIHVTLTAFAIVVLHKFLTMLEFGLVALSYVVLRFLLLSFSIRSNEED